MNTIFQYTIPVFQKSLHALDALLVKAHTIVTENRLDESALLEARLAPDMFPLKKQIQVACDNAKGATARLSGNVPPSHPDEEKTFEELRARIAKTIEYIGNVPEEAFAHAESRHITLPYFPGKYLLGSDYVREYALPNFFFHVVTAYDILRTEGFDIGKANYIGGLPLHDAEETPKNL